MVEVLSSLSKCGYTTTVSASFFIKAKDFRDMHNLISAFVWQNYG